MQNLQVTLGGAEHQPLMFSLRQPLTFSHQGLQHPIANSRLQLFGILKLSAAQYQHATGYLRLDTPSMWWQAQWRC